MEATQEYLKEMLTARKPLVYVIPELRDSQHKKNPFKKLAKHKTVEVAASEASKEFIANDTPANDERKMPSLSPSKLNRARTSLIQVPKPSDPIESMEEDDKELNANSPTTIAIGIKDRSSVLPFFRLSLDKEVRCNFEEIRKYTFFISSEEVDKKLIALPEVKDRLCKKTLLIDLDDTLVHTLNPKLNYSLIRINKSQIISTKYEDPYLKNESAIEVIVRPNALEFLQELRSLYELVVILFVSSLLGIYCRLQKVRHCLIASH